MKSTKTGIGREPDGATDVYGEAGEERATKQRPVAGSVLGRVNSVVKGLGRGYMALTI